MIMMVIIIITIIIYQYGKECQLCYFDTMDIKHVEKEESNEVRNFIIYVIWTKILNKISWDGQLLLLA